MEIITNVAEKDSNTGKKKILIEVNEDDIILLNEIIRSYEQSEKFDKDDNKVIKHLKHNRDEIHKAFTIVRPS